MHVDVLIPTYNRAPLLRRTLESLAAARVPEGMHVAVLVIDNNSRDDTRAVVDAFAGRFGRRLRYLFEPSPGRSRALNTGIAAAAGDLVGMIDDDEEVAADWFEEIARAFADPALDFITGPYVPHWGAEPPAWLPMRPNAVLGWVDGGPEVRTFGRDYDGVLMGGNAVIRLARLRETGGYDPSLGRSADGRLLSCEDEAMQRRLVATGAQGQYRPGLVIHHYVPPERMTKAYYRRWFFWHGVSSGVLARTSREPLPHLLGVPRHRIGRIAREALWLVPGLLGRGRLRSGHDRFDAAMHAIDLAGFWYGKYRFKVRGAAAAPESRRSNGAGAAPGAPSPRTATTTGRA